MQSAVGDGGEISKPLPVLSHRLIFPPAHTAWVLCPRKPMQGGMEKEENVLVVESATPQKGEGTYLGVQLLIFTIASHE